MIFEESVPIKARRAYTLDAWAGIFIGIYTGCIFPFYLIIARQQLHASSLLISAMVAAPFIGNLFALLWANAIEGRSKMRFAVTVWTIARGLLLLMVVAVSPFSFALIFCISQFLITAASPAYAAIMKDIYPDEYRGRIMGFVRVLWALAQIAAAFGAGWLLKNVKAPGFFSVGGYQWLFPLAGLFGIASAIAFSRIRTTPPDPDELRSKPGLFPFLGATFSILKYDRGFRWFAFSVFAYGFGALLVFPLYPIFLADRLRIDPGQVAILANTTGVVWMLSFLFWGRYVDQQSPLRATVLNVLLAVFCPLNYFLAAFAAHPNIWLLLPSAVLFGVTNAGIELAYFNSVLGFADENRVSHYQALFSWLLGIRGSIAPFIGGALSHAFAQRGLDSRYLFLVAALIMFAGAWMQIVGLRRDRAARKLV